MDMHTTRILLYPEGTEEEIEFLCWTGDGPTIPVVGDHVQILDRSDRSGGNFSRGPMFEVIKRSLYAVLYGHESSVLEAALTVREVQT